MNTHRPDPLDIGSVNVAGPLDRRIRLGLSHLLGQKERILESAYTPFHAEWGADSYSRWFGAVVLATLYTKDHVPALAKTVRDLIDAQQENGFFGKRQCVFTWFGAGRAMVSLLEYWQATGDAEALRSAERLGTFYQSNFPMERPDPDSLARGLAPNMNHFEGHVEGLVALSRATGNTEFLDLAEKVAATSCKELAGPGTDYNITRPHGHHTHAFLSDTLGYVDLYVATGKDEYLQHAQQVWDFVLDNCMWVSGGISEVSTYPFETRDETCSVADWLSLSLRLWRLTRDPKYMDVAEHTLLNHLYFDQDQSGGFCSFRTIAEDNTPKGKGRRDHVTYMCCSMHGIRVLIEAARSIYTHDDDGVDVNLFTACEAEVPVKGSTVRLKQVTDYPAQPTVRIEVQPKGELAFNLRLRIPHWTRSCRLAVKGDPIEVEPERGYASIQRVWKAGDTVEVTFEPYLRVVPEGVNGFSTTSPTSAPDETSNLKRAALVYGPLVLMLDQREDEPRGEMLVPRREDGELFLPKTPLPTPARGDFPVPEMCFMTLREPYDKGHEQQPPDPQHVQAGKLPVDSGSRRIQFLVPISEITGTWVPYSMRPYELRYDVRLLDAGESEEFLARVGAAFDSFVSRMSSTTTAYAMRLDREARR